MIRLLGVLALALATLAPAQAAEVKLLAANALRGPLLELVPAFEKATGHSVTLMGGGTESIARQVGDGSVVVDVVLIASINIDRLLASGRVAAGSRIEFARTGVAMAQRTGLPRPDVSTAEGVKQAVLAARTLAYSTGPSGFHVAELFRKWGIESQVKDKVRQPPSGTQIGDMLARGDVDLGFQQVSELAHVKGIDYLGPLPADIQLVTVYAMGLHVAAASPDAARQLMRFLAGPDAVAALKRASLDPP
jgi:molybdate transport system substrate-binding protein